MLAAVRSATAGTEPGPAAAAPYAEGRWLFSHNGAVPGWPGPLAGLAAGLPAADLLTLEARCDSALLWALVLQRLRAGHSAGRRAGRHHRAAGRRAGARPIQPPADRRRDDRRHAAGDTLCYHAGPGGVLVASEPDGGAEGWIGVPDGSVLEASAGSVSVRPIASWPPAGAAVAGDAGSGSGSPGRLSVLRCLPDGFLARSLREDARAGLTALPKTLPPKWFYDERGSELFEEITWLQEYYPTRAERAILRSAAGPIAAATRADTLVELGSGSSDKTRLLLDALREAGTLRGYVPVDVSESALVAGARRVLDQYPGLMVRAVVTDFEEYLGLPTAGGRACWRSSAAPSAT